MQIGIPLRTLLGHGVVGPSRCATYGDLEFVLPTIAYLVIQRFEVSVLEVSVFPECHVLGLEATLPRVSGIRSRALGIEASGFPGVSCARVRDIAISRKKSIVYSTTLWLRRGVFLPSF